MKYERMETYQAHYTDGTIKNLMCKKSEILDFITAKEFLKLDYVQQLNRGDDPVNHKPITKEKLVEMVGQ